MSKERILLYLTVVLSASLIYANMVFAQEKAETGSEPFTIRVGSSFQASGSGEGSWTPGANLNSAAKAISVEYSEALELVISNHVDTFPAHREQLNRSAIDSLLGSLDPHSSYYDPYEFSELLSEQNSEYFGIGSSIANFRTPRSRETYVTATFPGSPALQAGLRFGDRIVAVDGESMSGRTSVYVRNKVRGPSGSKVKIEIERAGDSELKTIVIERGRVSQPSIDDYYMLQRSTGYIDLSNGFNYTTNEELAFAIRNLSERGMKNLVLDLRDNPGGILEQAVRVAEHFLPAGSAVVSQKGRYSSESRTWVAKNPSPKNFTLVLLVNENSASASEIVAGALQDYDRALIVGERTFGKGLVQSVIDLPRGAGLTLTTAKYFTPSGRSIQREYSGSGLYDYYRHHTSPNADAAAESAATTKGGRKVYGGNGIKPDAMVEGRKLTSKQREMLDSLFLFTRRLAAGQVPGADRFGNVEQTQFTETSLAQLPDVGDDVIEAYLLSAETEFGITDARKIFADEGAYIAERIRFYLALSAFGTVAGDRVLAENDPQISKALEMIPAARRMRRSYVGR